VNRVVIRSIGSAEPATNQYAEQYGISSEWIDNGRIVDLARDFSGFVRNDYVGRGKRNKPSVALHRHLIQKAAVCLAARSLWPW
jgi:hypothetical protein